LVSRCPNLTLEQVVLSRTKQVLQAALALPSGERSQLIEALIACDLYRRADRALVVRAPVERCLESIPCQHSWSFAVERVLKGEEVSKEVSIYGRYRDHSEVPASMRIARGEGRFILFMPANAGDASAVLGILPWSEQAEAMLSAL
jgi:hypothetical protein